MDGKGANDDVHGESGVDAVYGGINDDFVYGGPGDDGLKGDDGNDHLQDEATGLDSDLACGGRGIDYADLQDGDNNDTWESVETVNKDSGDAQSSGRC